MGMCQVVEDFLNSLAHLLSLFLCFQKCHQPAVLSATLLSLNPTESQHLQAKVAQSYLLSITGQKGLACLRS